MSYAETIAMEMGTRVDEKRRETLALAEAAGADEALLRRLAAATRVRRRPTIVLPARYHGCSRSRGWARCGTGDSAQWGTETSAGYEVGPGRWTVHSSDGFRREERTTWTVTHVVVGAETWTVAHA